MYPLYSGGLWDAVITIPQIQDKSLTPKEISGVGLISSKIYVLILFALKILETISERYLPLFLLSYPIITFGFLIFEILMKLQIPCVALPKLYLFILLPLF